MMKISLLMRRSNCSAPIPPGVRENMRVIKKGGALEKRVILVTTVEPLKTDTPRDTPKCPS